MTHELLQQNTQPADRSAAWPSFHAMPLAAVLATFGTHAADGLSGERVAQLRSRYGYNELAPPPPVPTWKVLARQFNQLIVWILICAAIVSGVLGDRLDTLAILLIVVLNGVLGFFQEERAGRALAALKRLSSPHARVLRDGALQSLPARELVPGDRIELEAGDNIPADARLIAASALRVQEASLTGESVPVDKDAPASLGPETSLAERRNMAYMGTSATAGKASAVVVATGMATELGRIAGMLAESEPEPTPLQRRLSQLGKTLLLVVLGVVAVIFGLQVLRGGRVVDVFLLSVSLAVAAVPEGLPAVVTIALALGLQRMVKRNALIRRLPSVETLGSVTVICSDKTGTLTRNEMTVREVLAGGERYEVTGSGYRSNGEFLKNSAGGTPVPAGAEPDLLRALSVAAWCNHARLNPGDAGDGLHLVGDPTEGALVVAALKAGIEAANREHTLMFEIPFDSDRKRMSVVARWPEGAVVLSTKGAPESVLNLCDAELRHGSVVSLSDERRREILEAAGEMAERALRVLALA